MGNRLFVGNLSWEATEEELQSLFGEEATRVKIVTDRDTGRSRGFAFIEMVSDAAAASAIERLNGHVLLGRDLRVNEAHERERSGGGGFRGAPRHAPPPSRGDDRGRGRRRRDADEW